MKVKKTKTKKEQSSQVKNKDLSYADEVLIAGAKMQGKKLGYLIGILDIPDDTKEALLTMVQNMNAEQLENLIDILETNYLVHTGQAFDKVFEEELQEIKYKYDKKKGKVLKQSAKDIQELTNKIQQMVIKSNLE